MPRGSEPQRAHAIIQQFVGAKESMAGERPQELLELLLHTLPVHFALEERPGGLYARLRAAGAPPERIEALASEHALFLRALERLESASERGPQWTSELWGLAARLREHEWWEAALALQLQVEPPTDEGQRLPLPPLPPPQRALVEQVGQKALSLAREVPGRLLAGLTVSVPGGVAASMWQAAVEEELARLGLDFVEVRPSPGGGEADIEDCRFVSLGDYNPNFSMRLRS